MADGCGAVATGFVVTEHHEAANLKGTGDLATPAGSASVVASAPQPKAVASPSATAITRATPPPTPRLVASADRRLVAPMPGVIVICEKMLGEEVQKGDVVLILESMKMENLMTARVSGKVVWICKEGERVGKGAVLALIG